MEEEIIPHEMKIPLVIQEDIVKAAIAYYDVKVERTDFGCKLTGDKKELTKAKEFIVDSINKKLEDFEKQ